MQLGAPNREIGNHHICSSCVAHRLLDIPTNIFGAAVSIYLVIFYFVARINAGSTLQDPLPAVDEERVLQGTNPVLPAPSYSPGLRVTHASMKDLDDKPPLYSAEG